MNWTKSMSEGTNGDIIAFCGKTLRRIFDSAAGQIIERGVDYALAVKSSQPLLRQDVRQFFEDA